jgi:imidazole glycerol-phosphate synthase subunit HisH
MIAILDYGIGNLGSIKNMLKKIGAESVIANDVATVAAAEKLILPGVGAFDTGMDQLNRSGLREILTVKAMEDRVPVLGICLGAQMMTRSSEEGSQPGLGWFDAETRKFRFDRIEGKWPLPNIGWRDVTGSPECSLLRGFESEPRFYFVHSYLMSANDPAIVSMRTTYGQSYACGLHLENLHCVQFHPEKSHKFGMKMLRNFAEMV